MRGICADFFCCVFVSQAKGQEVVLVAEDVVVFCDVEGQGFDVREVLFAVVDFLVAGVRDWWRDECVGLGLSLCCCSWLV